MRGTVSTIDHSVYYERINSVDCNNVPPSELDAPRKRKRAHPSRLASSRIPWTVKVMSSLAAVLFLLDHKGVSSFTVRVNVVGRLKVKVHRHLRSLTSDPNDDATSSQISRRQPIQSTSTSNSSTRIGRRRALSVLAASGILFGGASASYASAMSSAGGANYEDTLEQLFLGDGKWAPLKGHRFETTTHIHPNFVTYATRILINYDPGVNQWWKRLQQRLSLLSDEKRNAKLSASFGALARSFELSVIDFLNQYPSHQQAYEQLWDRLSLIHI